MTEQELITAIETKMNSLIEAKTTGTMTKEAFDAELVALKASIEALPKQTALDGMKADMQKQFDELAMAIKAKNDLNENKQSIFDRIHAGLKANHENLKKLKAGDPSGRFSLEVKQVGTMTFTNSITGEIPQAMRLPGFNDTVKRMPFIRELITNSMTTSPTISYVYAITGEGGSNSTAEGNKKNQMDKDYNVGSVSVAKYTVFIKISEEMLEDIDFMASEVNNTLMVDLELKVDAVILAALISAATAFSAGTFAGTVASANKFDVLKVAINQILIANQPMPTSIVLHPSDVTGMELTKDANGMYLLPPFASASGLQVSGVRIVANTGQTVDNFLVLNGSKATAYFKNEIRVESGMESDDFVKNLRTILAETRFATLVKANDATAHVKGTFTAAIAALNAGS